jgi:hypothetical protein
MHTGLHVICTLITDIIAGRSLKSDFEIGSLSISREMPSKTVTRGDSECYYHQVRFGNLLIMDQKVTRSIPVVKIPFLYVYFNIPYSVFNHLEWVPKSNVLTSSLYKKEPFLVPKPSKFDIWSNFEIWRFNKCLILQRDSETLLIIVSHQESTCLSIPGPGEPGKSTADLREPSHSYWNQCLWQGKAHVSHVALIGGAKQNRAWNRTQTSTN